jgi:phosphohistidine phosphatase
MATPTGQVTSMKTLLVLRHAKTQADAPAGDHSRELTERGSSNAAAMGAYIHSLTGAPDAIITSDATRARQTAEIVARAVDFAAPLTLEPRIYAAGPETLLAVVRRIPDEVHSALIVGHNPGFEELAAVLAGNHDQEIRLPTSGLALLEFDVERWDAVREGAGRLREVATPGTINSA